MTDQIFYEELRATIRDAIASYLDTYTGEELRELATESFKLPTPTWPIPQEWRLADHKRYGRVIVTNDIPNSRGHIYFVYPADNDAGYDWFPADPDELAYIDTTSDVPPNTLAVGSVWDEIYALEGACGESGRDQIVVSDSTGDVFVWGKKEEWWEDPVPPRHAPFTIIHTGKKADE